MKGKQTAIYCRVDRGGDPNHRQYALEMQRKKLERYAKAKGFQVSGFYVDDGFTGCDLERPGLTQLISDYHAGAFEQVLVVNRSRLYRGNRWDEPKWPFQVCSLNQLEHDQIR